ncbi:hypothetical protein ACI7YT_16480 [Microbacterium sp. M]|uniref:hypothetical protein n=1 Tax=Microbacterium sp. M TaxID=3377125 RepID=UPI00386A7117
MDNPSSQTRRRWPVIAGIAVLVVAAVVIWLLIARPWSTDTVATPPLPSPTSTPTAEPTPLTSASGTPVTPTPLPTASDSPIAPELAPVEPTQPAVGSDGVVVSLPLVEAIEGEGVAPGETSGPAIRVTVRIENATDEPLDTAFIIVNAYTGADRKPAPALTKPGGEPFEGTIAPGDSAEGVFLFTVAADARSDVTIGVDYRAGEATVVFEGALD